jgi:hypothetical protein
MNNRTDSKRFVHAARIIFALFAGFFFVPPIHAQPTATNVDNRYLFIFETSSTMKKRVPGVQKALDTMLATSVYGQLHSGDSIGVWTFGQELRTGEFPLEHWDPSRAAIIASNITTFVRKQHYTRSASFDALQPWLNQVVGNSERLTVIIFCDGDSAIGVTPYDTGINRMFQENQPKQKKARQPFVIVLRSQLGEYVGCTVNFPPTPVNFPGFPPMPAPRAPTNTSPPAPPAEAPPLIIVGTKVGTNLPPPAPELMETNPPPKIVTNAPAPTERTNVVSTPPTNSVVPTSNIARTNIIAQMNRTAAPPPENSGMDSNGALAIGATLLAVAGTLTILILRRARRSDHSSLITRSMNEK